MLPACTATTEARCSSQGGRHGRASTVNCAGTATVNEAHRNSRDLVNPVDPVISDPVRPVNMSAQRDSTHFTFANSLMTSHHRTTTSSDHRIANDVSATNAEVSCSSVTNVDQRTNKDALPELSVDVSESSLTANSSSQQQSRDDESRAVSVIHQSVNSLQSVLGKERTQRLIENLSEMDHVTSSRRPHTASVSRQTTTLHAAARCRSAGRTAWTELNELKMNHSSLALRLHDVSSLRHDDVELSHTQSQSDDNDDDDDDVLAHSRSSLQQHIDGIKSVLRHR